MAALKPKENHVSGTHAYSALDSQGSLFRLKYWIYILMMCVLGRVLQLLADDRPVPPVCHDTEASLPC